MDWKAAGVAGGAVGAAVILNQLLPIPLYRLLPLRLPRLPVAGANLDPPAQRLIAFGYRRGPEHTHQGVDIPADAGAPVHAVKGGRVAHAHDQLAAGFSGYGKVVVIESPPTHSTPRLWHLYAHLQDVYVRAGQPVAGGVTIGTVGRTCYRRGEPQALCGGNHLHYEVSPRPYPQPSEASRIDPAQAYAALRTSRAVQQWRTT